MNTTFKHTQTRPPQGQYLRLASLLCALLTSPAYALDFNWSGFATLGYTRSDQDFTYERVIKNSGTLKRDSVLGLQLVSTFNPQWSTTLQTRFAPSSEKNFDWDVGLTWAFVSFRPNNDWLLRAGKLRMPMYLFSENMDVSASYDVMRMPTEVYSTAPSTDYTGASFSRQWNLANSELNLEAYFGRTKLSSTAPSGSGGQNATLRTRTGGLVLSLHQDENVFRLGLQRAYVGFENDNGGFPGGSSSTNPAMNSGSTANTNPPPANPPDFPASRNGFGKSDIKTNILLLGTDLQLSPKLRLISEYAKRSAPDFELAQNSQGAYLTLLYKLSDWTPYVSYARLLTDSSARKTSTNYLDQTSLVLGASYALNPSSKLKLEWLHLRVAENSLLVENHRQSQKNEKQSLNVLSISYSAAY